MDCDNSTRQMLERVAVAVCRRSPQTEMGPVQFSIRQIEGHGATSNNYQIQFSAGTDGGRSYFVKQYADETAFALKQLNTDFRTAKCLAARLGQSSAFCVDAPVLLVPEDRVLVTAYVSGENLGSYFFKKLRWHFIADKDVAKLVDIAAKIGAGLEELQSLPLKTLSRVFDERQPEALLNRYREELGKLRSFYSVRNVKLKLIDKAVKAIDDCLEGYLLGDPAYCFQHNDFILQNFIIGDDSKLHLFDFANSSIGIPCFDTAHLLNSLEDMTYLKTVSGSLVDQLKRAFLSQLSNSDRVHARLLAAMRAYIQIYSGMIILSSAESSKQNPLRNLFMSSPKERLENKLLAFFEEIDH